MTQPIRTAIAGLGRSGWNIHANLLAPLTDLYRVIAVVDGEEARRVGGPEGAWFVQMAENLYAPWTGRKVPDSYKFAVDAIQTERVDKTAQDHLDSGAFAMGTPDEIIDVMKKYQEAGVDQVLCFVQPGNLPHTNIMDSIKLMGRHVIPHFNAKAS